tara:strand:- start:15498 stop:16820 length:1323 start_codon:yes stop_codon:yes gene_type:complete
VQVEVEYDPRPQFIPFHQRDQRFACLVCHRRAGKTVGVLQDTIAKALYTKKKKARYAYIAPFYRQAKDVAWEYLKDFTRDVTVKVRESQLRVELINGSWITLYGADNPDALRGLYLDGVVLDEAGDMRPGLWEDVVLPALADRRGWAVFIGTPKGKNHFFKIHERATNDNKWFNLVLKASDTNLIAHEDLEEIRSIQDESSYLQEFECSFEASIKGAYYNETFMNYPIEKKTTWDPDYKVSVSSDLGKSDSTALWFYQIIEGRVRCIDYYEAHDKDLDHYFMVLDSKPYEYDTMWLPHDAVAKTLATTRSTIEQFIAWVDSRWRVEKVPRLSVQHGIDAVRMVLRLTTMDPTNCEAGINALRHYKRRYNDITKSYSDLPQHDWASDGADAFRYLALVAKVELEPEEVKVETDIKPAEYTLDELWKEKDNGDNWRSRTIRI